MEFKSKNILILAGLAIAGWFLFFRKKTNAGDKREWLIEAYKSDQSIKGDKILLDMIQRMDNDEIAILYEYMDNVVRKRRLPSPTNPLYGKIMMLNAKYGFVERVEQLLIGQSVTP